MSGKFKVNVTESTIGPEINRGNGIMEARSHIIHTFKYKHQRKYINSFRMNKKRKVNSSINQFALMNFKKSTYKMCQTIDVNASRN